MEIQYKHVSEFPGWGKSESFVKKLILENDVKTVLEIGAGANPTISADFTKKNNLDYTISDVDKLELEKADPIYKKIILDLSIKNSTADKKYDLVFSRMVGEHISDGRIFHKNIYNLLNDGGLSFHCFSTLFALPFFVNHIMPDFISNLLLKKIAPRDEVKHAKFRAYYDWCRGPSKKMVNRYESIGFKIAEYTGYFGHNYYNKIPLLQSLENFKSKLLLKAPLSYCTSYAYILLKK